MLASNAPESWCQWSKWASEKNAGRPHAMAEGTDQVFSESRAFYYPGEYAAWDLAGLSEGRPDQAFGALPQA
jgi:hypothetical protein